MILCSLVQGDVETRADVESTLLAKSDKRVSSCPCATWVLISPQGSGLWAVRGGGGRPGRQENRIGVGEEDRWESRAEGARLRRRCPSLALSRREREEDVKEVRAWLWTGRQTLVTHWRDVDSLRWTWHNDVGRCRLQILEHQSFRESAKRDVITYCTCSDSIASPLQSRPGIYGDLIGVMKVNVFSHHSKCINHNALRAAIIFMWDQVWSLWENNGTWETVIFYSEIEKDNIQQIFTKYLLNSEVWWWWCQYRGKQLCHCDWRTQTSWVFRSSSGCLHTPQGNRMCCHVSTTSTGCFFTGSVQKVLSMKLVPPNREKRLVQP